MTMTIDLEETQLLLSKDERSTAEVKTRKRQSLPPLSSHPVNMSTTDRSQRLSRSKSFERELALHRLSRTASSSPAAPAKQRSSVEKAMLRASMDKPLPPAPLNMAASVVKPSIEQKRTYKPRVTSMMSLSTTSWLDLDEKPLPTAPKQNQKSIRTKYVPLSKFSDPMPEPPRSSILRRASRRMSQINLSSFRLSKNHWTGATDVTSQFAATTMMW